MTFLYGTNMELLYSLPAIGFTNATTTITCINTAATIAPYQMPALGNIWTPSSLVGKGLMFVFSGGYNTTAGANAMSLQFDLDLALATTAASSATMATCGLCTVPTSSAGVWQAQAWATCVGASGTLSTWYVMGDVFMGVGNNETGAASTVNTSTFMWSGPAVALGVPSAVTIPTNVGLFPGLYSKFASAATVTTTQELIFGIN
jgi:hypothetical protein